MSADSWLARRLRSRAAVPTASGVARQAAARAALIRRRRPELPERAPVARKLVVCGDDPLALRLINELISRYSAEVTAIIPSRRRNLGPRIARLPGVRVIESAVLDVETFRHARLQHADAVAMVKQDDVGNIHAALQAQEVNPRIRLVLRMFNMSLGHGVRRLFHDCAVLSDAAMAAPAFVSAALGEVAPVHVRLQGRTLYVAERRNVRPGDVVCGLARTSTASGGVDMLPSDPANADLVLAIANGGPASVIPAMRDGTDELHDGVGPSTGVELPVDGGVGRTRRPDRFGRALRRLTRPFVMAAGLISPKLRLIALVLFALLVSGTVALALLKDLSWWNGAYWTILTTLGGAEPEIDAKPAEKILQALLTIVSVALVPVVTAAVVEAVVNARLALTLGKLRGRISDHVVVVGLGNVGTRVIRQLHELGVPVVAVDKSDAARGSHIARTLGIPLIIGDASREETLRSASVQTCRALVCLSTDDVTNLEAALYGQGLKEDLRVVLRLFDGDFADRAQRAFGITISRSVSYLAAPEFAAALVERQVIGTIPINRRVLLIAEAPVCAGSPLDGRTVANANEVGQARVIALTSGRGRNATRWSPSESQVLRADDVLTVVGTRTGLARMLAETGDPLARDGLRSPERSAGPPAETGGAAGVPPETEARTDGGG